MVQRLQWHSNPWFGYGGHRNWQKPPTFFFKALPFSTVQSIIQLEIEPIIVNAISNPSMYICIYHCQKLEVCVGNMAKFWHRHVLHCSNARPYSLCSYWGTLRFMSAETISWGARCQLLHLHVGPPMTAVTCQFNGLPWWLLWWRATSDMQQSVANKYLWLWYLSR